MSTHHDESAIPGSREAELEAWAHELDRREAALDTWERSLRAEQHRNLRTGAPSAPVAAAVRQLQVDGEFHPELEACARGLDLDPRLLAGILDGSVAVLELPAIRAVCEGLHCSPYDLWGTEVGQQLLSVYGPEHWPRHIEPLDDRAGNVTFITGRLDRQVNRTHTERPGSVDTSDTNPVAHLSLHAAVAGGDLEAITATVKAIGLDAEAAMVELRQAGVRLQDAVAVAVRVGATPADGIAAVRDTWHVEDLERLCRLAGCPTSVAAEAATIGVGLPAETATGAKQTTSLIDRWAAVADGPSSARGGPVPLPPAS